MMRVTIGCAFRGYIFSLSAVNANGIILVEGKNSRKLASKGGRFFGPSSRGDFGAILTFLFLRINPFDDINPLPFMVLTINRN